MSYELLEKIRNRSLPVEINGEDADIARAYAAAGLIIADFNENQGSIARILALTVLGRKTLDARLVRKSLAKFKSRK